MREALPVTVEMEEPVAARLRAYLEGTLGWQVIDDSTRTVVPPLCRLVGVDTEPSSDPSPTVLLVTDDDAPAAAAVAAVRSDPIAVMRWPEDRERLAEELPSILSRSPHRDGMEGELRVGAAAGGVGATTIAIGLGALLAWSGRPTLVVASGPVPVPDVRMLAPDDLESPGTWRAAALTPGCPALRVVRTASGSAGAAVDGGPLGATVIRDLGRAEDADVLVLRRDRAGVEALDVTSAGVAVVVDDGVVPIRHLSRLAGHRRLLVVPSSVRVARAHALQRIPGSLPGAWLRVLAPLARELHPQGRTGPGRGAVA